MGLLSMVVNGQGGPPGRRPTSGRSAQS